MDPAIVVDYNAIVIIVRGLYRATDDDAQDVPPERSHSVPKMLSDCS